jgi:hypothetical protein
VGSLQTPWKKACVRKAWLQAPSLLPLSTLLPTAGTASMLLTAMLLLQAGRTGYKRCC